MPPRQLRFILNFAVPLAFAMGLSFALYLALTWSARQSDYLAQERQSQLVTLIVSNMQADIAHDQESSSVWDDAVRVVMNQTPDREWLENNLGQWMQTYFQHDGAFIVSPKDDILLGFLDGQTDRHAAYARIADVARPLIEKLRSRLVRQDDTGVDDHVLSIGESDIGSIGARPAIISLKPIISDSGNIEQVPGQEFIHIAVRFLDGNFLDTIGRDYLFENLQFTRIGAVGDSQSRAPLRTVSGKLIGYLTWKPFRPGTAVLGNATPFLAGGAALLLGLTGFLGALAWRRSSHLIRSRRQLEHMAHSDGLTGLPNRASFSRHLGSVLATRRPADTVAALYLDLDRFKEVNDTLGHPVGDALLIEVAARLKDTIGQSAGMAARVGGDEFTVAVTAADIESIERLCELLVAAVRRPFVIQGHPITIGLSAGVAIAAEDCRDASELTRKADIALYHAKAAGRNRYAIFGSHMDELVRARRQMEQDLRIALEGHQISVHYQPVYSAKDQVLKGVEALVRWRHPQKGAIPPDVFIPVAEETRLIEPLGELVLREACFAAVHWPDLTVAVNVSAIELRNETYAMRVLSTLNAAGLNPTRLEIEITESALGDNSGHCERNIAALRALGIRFALDDFGTGFSSFGRLQSLDVDRIKIDKCFVDGFGKPGGNEEIVRAMIKLAQAKGLRTTAEGIETPEQNAVLQRLGCDDVQGYLLSRPVPAAAIDAMLASDAGIGRAL
ncbi:putative bifunctional diguanylate cyclase/phosphodiesterase [Shinella zoogloeoides]|uniref:putative bifunctional diguanylate cyclase/phosphodiesterase n=1 Tax=Shinella zoogloeoides TaxID=352475 RepID=UPI00273F9475|nr:EAL domain-containing protein [Shinella zoogloeoides]WLR95438.1 EAL domain-containing protein [Shinella zoogloeoides]